MAFRAGMGASRFGSVLCLLSEECYSGTGLNRWRKKHLRSMSLGASSLVDAQSVRLKDNVVELRWLQNPPKTSQFHADWLRFQCQCEKCRQPHSNQRILDVGQLPPKLSLVDAKIEGDRLKLHWLVDFHLGYIQLDWLKSFCEYTEMAPKVFQGQDPPKFNYHLALKSNPPEILNFFRRLIEEGFCIVENTPVTSGFVKMFTEEILGIPVQRTIYGEIYESSLVRSTMNLQCRARILLTFLLLFVGTIFDVLSTPAPINVAYSNAELKLHMDLVYYESPPGLQLLHCLQFDESVQGGESTLVDAFFVAEDMRRRYPREFDILTSTPATFEKIHFDRQLPVWMRYARPHITLSGSKEVNGVFWAPQFEGPLFASLERAPLYYDAYRKFSFLLEHSPNKKTFKLRPGQIIVFNNRRMVHGRNAFTVGSGTRHFQGCYVHIDEFKSQVQVALQRSGLPVSVPRVGNQSGL